MILYGIMVDLFVPLGSSYKVSATSLDLCFLHAVKTVKQNAPLKFPLLHQAVAMLAPHLHIAGKCSKGVNPHVKWSSASTPIDEKSLSID